MEKEILIQKIAYGGEGLGTLQGKICFVGNALPGENVRVQITENKKKFLNAKVVKRLTESPQRVTPPCPYLSDCGGCQYQHMTYEEELRWKEIQVREYFQRNLKIPP